METLKWDVLSHHLAGDNPVLLPMGGTKGAQIGFEPSTHRLLLRIPTTADTVAPALPFAELEISLRPSGSDTCLEVATAAPELYRELHRFAGLLTEDLELSERPVRQALDTAIERWIGLTAIRSSLSSDQQIGLLGELTLLSALIARDGASVVHAWTASSADRRGRHDFELATIDVEVKATRSSLRSHVVHGLHQLSPAPNRRLFLLSMKFEPSGSSPGVSLAESVTAVRGCLSGDTVALKRFEDGIEAVGYRTTDEELYRNRFRLADAPRLISVDEHCPRLSSAGLAVAIPAQLLARISDVTYRINVEGLGFPEGSPEFDEFLGGVRTVK